MSLAQPFRAPSSFALPQDFAFSWNAQPAPEAPPLRVSLPLLDLGASLATAPAPVIAIPADLPLVSLPFREALRVPDAAPPPAPVAPPSEALPAVPSLPPAPPLASLPPPAPAAPPWEALPVAPSQPPAPPLASLPPPAPAAPPLAALLAALILPPAPIPPDLPTGLGQALVRPPIPLDVGLHPTPPPFPQGMLLLLPPERPALPADPAVLLEAVWASHALAEWAAPPPPPPPLAWPML